METNDKVLEPHVLTVRALSMNVCVPVTYTDEEVERFANRKVWCGTENGWKVVKKGNVALAGDEERVQCELRPGFVHMVLNA